MEGPGYIVSGKPDTLIRTRRELTPDPLIRQPLRPLGRNHPGVDSAPVQPAEEPPVLDFHAAIHDRLESRAFGLLRRLGVRHAQLLPQHFRADRDRVLGDRHDLFGFSEAIDDVHLHRDIAQRLVAFLAEDGVVSRVDRDHRVAVLEHVFRREVARPEPVARKADDGDDLAGLEDAAQSGNVVDHGRDSIESCGIVSPFGKTDCTMAGTVSSRTAAQILVDALEIHGVDTAFCVPGESYLAVLDALYDARDSIRLVVARQDGGAAYMAEAWAKVTGRPGICFVTRGPGATNASIGVHTAQQDSTPLILFIGQVPGEFADRESFQEMDYRQMFGPMAKWVAQIERADRMHEYVSHACQLAMSGRPGPVVLALPEDMLTQTANVPDVAPYQAVQASPSAGDLEKLRGLLAGAKRPLAILGGTVWTREACRDLQAFAQSRGLPVACSFRFQDLFDNRHDHYVGDVGIGINPKLAERVRSADLLPVVGARLGEMTTGAYTLVEPPRPKQKLVHVHAGAEELGRVYQGELLINSGMPQIAAALKGMKLDGSAWRAWREQARADYLEWTKPTANPGRVQLAEIVAWLRERLPEDAIIANGAGNFAGWISRFYRYPGLRTQVAPTNGSMGYGVPAGVAAKVAHPERVVVSINGDGDFLMNGQELATAVQYGLPVIFVVVNNGMYGTIRMHQERDYPARVYGTLLKNPDFAALARAYGAHGETVEETRQFAPAFERAASAGKPALIEG